MPRRILYISDSLGTPIHPRGIYHYSLALVQVLNQLGFEIDLLVEKVDGFGEPDFLNLGETAGKPAFDAFAGSEIFRYFSQREFAIYLHLRDCPSCDSVIVPVARDGHPGSVYIAEREDAALNRSRHLSFKRTFNSIRNYHRGQTIFQSRGRHLSQFAGFVWSDYVYSDAATYAVNDLPPPAIDASGYDLVVIDTPHYLNVTGIDRSKIFSVIYDLIPVRDFSMGAAWRRIFMQKLKATLEHDSRLIFISEFARDQFRRELPELFKEDSFIIYPTIRDEDVVKASAATSLTRSTYMASLDQMRRRDKRFNVGEFLKRSRNLVQVDDLDLETADKEFKSWDATLPYFCTALSDEPRKNISILLEVSKQFVGRVNFILMGKLDGNAHMQHDPLSFPNVHFTGYASEEDKDDIFRKCAGVIFPSYAEGFGIPVVEGALYRKPLLCSDIAVFREITLGNAHHFDPYDADSLADAIEAVLRSPAECQAMADKLFPTLIERFSQDAMRAAISDQLHLA